MRMTVVTAIAALGLVVLDPGHATGQATADSVQIREIVEGYIVGWRTADEDLLSQVFATDRGVLLWPSGDRGQEVLNGMTFGEILARGRRPNQAYGTTWSIRELDIVDGKLAVAKVDIARDGGSYIDYLVLYKLSDGWRIVTKTYVVR